MTHAFGFFISVHFLHKIYLNQSNRIPLTFTIPVSMTYFTPGIVIEVSAMFVARIIFL